jgi:hypothetical protein
MKFLAVLTFLATTSVFAQVDYDPKIMEEIKKFEATFFNLKVGNQGAQTATQTLKYKLDGKSQTCVTKTLRNQTVLKVEADLIYTYVTVKLVSSTCGETQDDMDPPVVQLEDRHFEKPEVVIESMGIAKGTATLKKNLLTINATAMNDNTVNNVSLKAVIDLNKNAVCSYASLSFGGTTESEEVGTVNFVNTGSQKCIADAKVPDLKKLDLSDVNFCDDTLDTECEWVKRDMSFLTKDL